MATHIPTVEGYRHTVLAITSTFLISISLASVISFLFFQLDAVVNRYLPMESALEAHSLVLLGSFLGAWVAMDITSSMVFKRANFRKVTWWLIAIYVLIIGTPILLPSTSSYIQANLPTNLPLEYAMGSILGYAVAGWRFKNRPWEA